MNIETYLRKIARDFDGNQFNPPYELRVAPDHVPDEWVFVGLVPAPKTRLGWFVHHLLHGIAMGYPLKSIVAFSLLNTNVRRRNETAKQNKTGRFMAQSG